MALFRNPKPAVYVITAFVVLFLLLLAFKARANPSDGLAVEGGYTLVRGPAPVLALTYAWPGPNDASWLCRMSLVGSTAEAPNQSALGCQLIAGYKQFDLGLGMVWLHHTDRYNGSNLNFMLSAAYRLNERWALRYVHWSNAGQSEHNVGRDMLVVSRKF